MTGHDKAGLGLEKKKKKKPHLLNGVGLGLWGEFGHKETCPKPGLLPFLLKFFYPYMHYIMDNVLHVLLHPMQPFLLEPHSPSHTHTQNNNKVSL